MGFNPKLYLVNDLDTAWQMKSWLGQRRDVLGLDTETSGLSPYLPGSRLRTIQIGDHEAGWTVPWEMWGGVALECLNAWQGPIALHNASFDAKWLKVHAGWDLPWERTYDTMLMAQLVAPGEPDFTLKNLAARHIDPRANAEQKQLKQIFKKNDWTFDTIPIEVPTYWIYSALDPVLTAHLWSEFPAHKVFPKSFDLEMATLRITTNMEHAGMRIDVDYSDEMFHKTMDEVEQAKKWAQDNWGISVGSNQQLVEFIQKHFGPEVFTELTASGAPSVNVKQLEKFTASEDRNIAQVAKFVLGVRAKEKVGNAYFKNFVDMNVDGILHANIKTMGARTGRMSVTSPALQTIPSGKAEVRNAFLPDNEDQLIVSSDYSQMELRLLAHFSEDPMLQEAFFSADKTGEDFFTNLGKQIYQDPGFVKADPRRGLVKSTMYGLIYGAGPQKLAETSGVPVSEMKEVSGAIHSTYPGIKAFMKSVENEGKKRERKDGVAYITTGTGRKIPSDEGKIYTLVNYLLQGTGAELLKQSLVRLDAAGYGPLLKMPIHDEIIFSIPKDDIKDALPEIEELMSYKDGQFAVDQLAEPEGGFLRWGAKYEKDGS